MYVYNGDDIIKKLSDRGYTSYVIKKQNLLSQGTLTKIRNGGNITLDTLNVLCCLLKCQITDIVTIEVTDEEKLKYF